MKACCIAFAYCLLPCVSQSLQFAGDAGKQLNSSAHFLVKKGSVSSSSPASHILETVFPEMTI